MSKVTISHRVWRLSTVILAIALLTVSILAVYAPYTSPSLRLDSTGASYSYLIETDGRGWYRAISGTTGAVAFSGTDAATVINAALAVGNTYVKEGIYPIASALLINQPTIFAGSGYNTILQATTGIESTLAIIRICSNNVVIRDLHIDGNKAAGFDCLGIGVDGANGGANGATNCLILDNWIENTYREGIVGSGMKNIKVLRNVITNTGDPGYYPQGGHCIYFSYAEDCLISQNYCQPATGVAIKMTAIPGEPNGGYYGKNSQVIENWCVNNRIHISGVNDLTIAQNKIINSPYGIHLVYSGPEDLNTNVNIFGNEYIGNGTAGQYVILQGNNINYHNNVQRGTASGVTADFGKDITIQNNEFYGCTVSDMVIYVNKDGMRVQGNKIVDWNLSAILIEGADDTQVNDNQITRTTGTSGNGIYLINSNRTQIVGNKVGGAAYGIRENDSDYSMIISNDCYNCTTGVYVVGANSKHNLNWNGTTWETE